MKTSKAIKLFGSVKNLADALGITVHAIYQWGETVPELRVYQISEKSEKIVPPRDRRQMGNDRRQIGNDRRQMGNDRRQMENA